MIKNVIEFSCACLTPIEVLHSSFESAKKKIDLYVYSLVILVFCNGCTPSSVVKVKDFLAEGAECQRKEVYESQAFKELSKKHRLFKTENGQVLYPTAKDYEDSSLVTPQESELVVELHNNYAKCRKWVLENSVNSVPELIPMFVEGYKGLDLIDYSLISKDLSWGQYMAAQVRSIHHYVPKLRTKLTEVMVLRVRSDSQKSHAVNLDLGVTDAAKNALSVWAIQQKQLYAIQEKSADIKTDPLVTNCIFADPNSLSCTNTGYVGRYEFSDTSVSFDYTMPKGNIMTCTTDSTGTKCRQ